MFLGELMDGLVNFYRHSNDQKVAINAENGDKSGDKVTIKSLRSSRK